jgi:uncharacterized membrane protein
MIDIKNVDISKKSDLRYDKSIATVAIVIGAFAVIMSSGAALALMDIACGKETDLIQEWIVVWAALAVIVGAQIVSIAAVVRLRRRQETAKLQT